MILSPLFACGMFLSAFLTSALVLRLLPAARREVEADSARLRPLDGLRAWLAMGVLTSHAVVTWLFLQGRPWSNPPSRFFTQTGEGGVALFFMVTAFLFWGRVVATRGRIDWGDFLIARICRLYPVYIVLLASVLAVVAVLSGFTLREPIGTLLTGLRAWLFFTLPRSFDLNGVAGSGRLVGPAWSLAYEAMFYIALPFAAALVYRVWRPAVLAVCAVLIVLIAAQSGWKWPFRSHIWLAFLGGILAAHLARSGPFCRWARSHLAGALALGCLGIAMTQFSTAYTWGATVSYAGFFVIIACGHSLWGLLERPAVLWLGHVSYGVYLLHCLVLFAVVEHLGGWLDPARSSEVLVIALSMTTAVVTVLVASIVSLTVELPGIAFGRRLIAQRRARRAAPAG